ncbi:MAG: hypothetical protein AB7R69_03770 [Candidatus Babeliales bacterium]
MKKYLLFFLACSFSFVVGSEKPNTLTEEELNELYEGHDDTRQVQEALKLITKSSEELHVLKQSLFPDIPKIQQASKDLSAGIQQLEVLAKDKDSQTFALLYAGIWREKMALDAKNQEDQAFNVDMAKNFYDKCHHPEAKVRRAFLNLAQENIDDAANDFGDSIAREVGYEEGSEIYFHEPAFGMLQQLQNPILNASVADALYNFGLERYGKSDKKNAKIYFKKAVQCFDHRKSQEFLSSMKFPAAASTENTQQPVATKSEKNERAPATLKQLGLESNSGEGEASDILSLLKPKNDAAPEPTEFSTIQQTPIQEQSTPQAISLDTIFSDNQCDQLNSPAAQGAKSLDEIENSSGSTSLSPEEDTQGQEVQTSPMTDSANKKTKKATKKKNQQISQTDPDSKEENKKEEEKDPLQLLAQSKYEEALQCFQKKKGSLASEKLDEFYAKVGAALNASQKKNQQQIPVQDLIEVLTKETESLKALSVLGDYWLNNGQKVSSKKSFDVTKTLLEKADSEKNNKYKEEARKRLSALKQKGYLQAQVISLDPNIFGFQQALSALNDISSINADVLDQENSGLHKLIEYVKTQDAGLQIKVIDAILKTKETKRKFFTTAVQMCQDLADAHNQEAQILLLTYRASDQEMHPQFFDLYKHGSPELKSKAAELLVKNSSLRAKMGPSLGLDELEKFAQAQENPESFLRKNKDPYSFLVLAQWYAQGNAQVTQDKKKALKYYKKVINTTANIELKKNGVEQLKLLAGEYKEARKPLLDILYNNKEYDSFVEQCFAFFSELKQGSFLKFFEQQGRYNKLQELSKTSSKAQFLLGFAEYDKSLLQKDELQRLLMQQSSLHNILASHDILKSSLQPDHAEAFKKYCLQYVSNLGHMLTLTSQGSTFKDDYKKLACIAAENYGDDQGYFTCGMHWLDSKEHFLDGLEFLKKSPYGFFLIADRYIQEKKYFNTVWKELNKENSPAVSFDVYLKKELDLLMEEPFYKGNPLALIFYLRDSSRLAGQTTIDWQNVKAHASFFDNEDKSDYARALACCAEGMILGFGVERQGVEGLQNLKPAQECFKKSYEFFKKILQSSNNSIAVDMLPCIEGLLGVYEYAENENSADAKEKIKKFFEYYKNHNNYLSSIVFLDFCEIINDWLKKGKTDCDNNFFIMDSLFDLYAGKKTNLLATKSVAWFVRSLENSLLFMQAKSPTARKEYMKHFTSKYKRLKDLTASHSSHDTLLESHLFRSYLLAAQLGQPLLGKDFNKKEYLKKAFFGMKDFYEKSDDKKSISELGTCFNALLLECQKDQKDTATLDEFYKFLLQEERASFFDQLPKDSLLVYLLTDFDVKQQKSGNLVDQLESLVETHNNPFAALALSDHMKNKDSKQAMTYLEKAISVGETMEDYQNCLYIWQNLGSHSNAWLSTLFSDNELGDKAKLLQARYFRGIALFNPAFAKVKEVYIKQAHDLLQELIDEKSIFEKQAKCLMIRSSEKVVGGAQGNFLIEGINTLIENTRAHAIKNPQGEQSPVLESYMSQLKTLGEQVAAQSPLVDPSKVTSKMLFGDKDENQLVDPQTMVNSLFGDEPDFNVLSQKAFLNDDIQTSLFLALRAHQQGNNNGMLTFLAARFLDAQDDECVKEGVRLFKECVKNTQSSNPLFLKLADVYIYDPKAAMENGIALDDLMTYLKHEFKDPVLEFHRQRLQRALENKGPLSDSFDQELETKFDHDNPRVILAQGLRFKLNRDFEKAYSKFSSIKNSKETCFQAYGLQGFMEYCGLGCQQDKVQGLQKMRECLLRSVDVLGPCNATDFDTIEIMNSIHTVLLEAAKTDIDAYIVHMDYEIKFYSSNRGTAFGKTVLGEFKEGLERIYMAEDSQRELRMKEYKRLYEELEKIYPHPEQLHATIRPFLQRAILEKKSFFGMNEEETKFASFESSLKEAADLPFDSKSPVFSRVCLIFSQLKEAFKMNNDKEKMNKLLNAMTPFKEKINPSSSLAYDMHHLKCDALGLHEGLRDAGLKQLVQKKNIYAAIDLVASSAQKDEQQAAEYFKQAITLIGENNYPVHYSSRHKKILADFAFNSKDPEVKLFFLRFEPLDHGPELKKTQEELQLIYQYKERKDSIEKSLEPDFPYSIALLKVLRSWYAPHQLSKQEYVPHVEKHILMLQECCKKQDVRGNFGTKNLEHVVDNIVADIMIDLDIDNVKKEELLDGLSKESFIPDNAKNFITIFKLYIGLMNRKKGTGAILDTINKITKEDCVSFPRFKRNLKEVGTSLMEVFLKANLQKQYRLKLEEALKEKGIL